jgi:hypothetical protein
MMNPIMEKDDFFETSEEFNNSSDQGGVMVKSRISNHYEVPNMTSMLYEYTNKEQDRVHQSFRTGNYVSLRDLPNLIVAGNVSSMQSSKIEENIYSIMERRSWVELSQNGGYFSKFEWRPDEYGLFKEEQSKLRKEKMEK